MSKENLEQFMSKLADSVKQHGERYFGIDAEALIALGAECGCEFTAEEFQEYAESKDDEYGIIYTESRPADRHFAKQHNVHNPDETVWIDIDSLISAYIESCEDH
jgi:hypothetical protein